MVKTRAIEVKCLGHKFEDGSVSLCCMDFDADFGERVVILGQNGSGKTTLFLHILGLLKPTSGSVRVMGCEVGTGEFEKIRGKIGMVFQEVDQQLIGPTVWDDIAFGPANAGWKRGEIENAVEEALAHFRIKHLADKVPHYLSGGEKRKVALAGTIIMNPGILLLDEPFAHLDPKSRKDLMGHIRHYANAERCVMIAEHDMSILPVLADRVCVLEKEKGVTFSGKAEELFMRRELMERADLDVPELQEMFIKLGAKGLDFGIPKDAEEAAMIISERLIAKKLPGKTRKGKT